MCCITGAHNKVYLTGGACQSKIRFMGHSFLYNFDVKKRKKVFICIISEKRAREKLFIQPIVSIYLTPISEISVGLKHYLKHMQKDIDFASTAISTRIHILLQ